MLTTLERELLLAARAKMHRPNIRCVCSALEAAITPARMKTGADFVKVNDAYSRLRDFVGRQVHPHQTLGRWQEAHGFARTTEQRRRDRINWISYMLGELE